MNLLNAVKEKVNRPFALKLKETKEIIDLHFKEFQPPETVVAWSGGKDSTVILFLVRQFYKDVPVVFNNTGVEYPETYNFIKFLTKEWSIDLSTTRYYKKSFWDCVKEYGLPTVKTAPKHQGALCCYYLKTRPMALAIKKFGWKGQFEGSMASDNRNRMFWAAKRGTCSHNKKMNICKIKPILWWTEEEVWRFIEANNIPCNTIYNKGASRCGCMPCTAYLLWRETLSRTNPKMYKIINRLSEQRIVSSITKGG